MEANNIRLPEAAEVVSSLSVFVEAFEEFDRLLNLRGEKTSQTIYQSPSFKSNGRSKDKYKKDKLANATASIEKIDKRLRELSESFVGLYLEVRGIIDNDIDNYHQKIILQWRYINGLSWPEISKKTGFEMSYCRRLHRNAISILVKKGISRKEGNE